MKRGGGRGEGKRDERYPQVNAIHYPCLARIPSELDVLT